MFFRAGSVAFGCSAIAVIMTGMGSGGTMGPASLCRGGAPVIAQDKESSVVWGMPGTVVAAGLFDDDVPLRDIPAAVEQRLR